jgi:hypothetical protein
VVPRRSAARLVVAAMARPDFDVAIIGGGPAGALGFPFAERRPPCPADPPSPPPRPPTRAGLAAAHALSSASGGAARVGVFERVPRFQARGAGFTLQPNGLEALRGISPRLYDRITSEGHRVLRGRMCTIRGEVLSVMDEATHPARKMEARWGHPWVSWAWSGLQALLADELPGGRPGSRAGHGWQGGRAGDGGRARKGQGGGGPADGGAPLDGGTVESPAAARTARPRPWALPPPP